MWSSLLVDGMEKTNSRKSPADAQEVLVWSSLPVGGMEKMNSRKSPAEAREDSN